MNQYRCETCYNAKCIWNHENPNAYSGCFPHKRLTIAAYWANGFMERVGCASHSEFICQGKKVMDLFVSLIISEMVYDDGDMYYKVNPEKYVEVLGRIVSGDEL